MLFIFFTEADFVIYLPAQTEDLRAVQDFFVHFFATILQSGLPHTSPLYLIILQNLEMLS